MDIVKSGRFKDAPWFSEEPVQCLIGGAGGIGSWLALFLTRAGFQCTIYDDDTIEEHNLGGQCFRTDSVSKNKVDEVGDLVHQLTGVRSYLAQEKYTVLSPVENYMFSAFDNMEARKTMFSNWKTHAASNPTSIFIDGRLRFEQLQIFCVTLANADEYEKEHLFDDSEVEAIDCTMKQTSHSAGMIASFMTAFFTNYIANGVTEDKEREVPFYFEYVIPINYMKYEGEN